MADFVLILISGREMVDNLDDALREADPKPWAFRDFKRQMSGIVPGAIVAWIEFVDENDRQVKRFTSAQAILRARRMILARVASPVVEQASTPFFPGFDFEFSFADVSDEPLDPPLPIEDVASRLNDRIAGLGLSAEDLGTLVRHAKSNKVGLFQDGAPRLADHFDSRLRSSIESSAGEAVRVEPLRTTLSPSALGEAIDDFARAVDKAGLRFTGDNTDLPRSVLAGVLAKRFVLLTGLSGSGKTLLARGLGQWFGRDHRGQQRYLVVPVRPDWTSPDPLLGYEDALLPISRSRRAWCAPEILQFILAAGQEPDRLRLLVLDEMNLAHVERYFADVLSGLESGEPVVPNLELDDGCWHLRTLGPPKLPLPDNLVIVGTVNVDETTYQFSPKVLDRAFSFEFRVAASELDPLAPAPRPVAPASESHHETILYAWRGSSSSPASVRAPGEAELVDLLRGLHESLASVGFEFGHRTLREAVRFAGMLAAAGVEDVDVVLDWIVMTKVLPRVHGSRLQLEPFLTELHRQSTGDGDAPVMPRTARKVGRMLAILWANQFVSFTE